MKLTEKIDGDLNSAMKAQEADKVRTLRTVKSSLHNAAIANKDELSDEQAVQILRQEAKKRKEAIELYKQGGREELASAESKELEIIDAYLPAAMDEAELGKIVDEAIHLSGATSPADMGKVMGVVMGKVKGQADGSHVSAMVKNRLIQ